MRYRLYCILLWDFTKLTKNYNNLLTKAEKGGNITKLSLEAGKGDKLKKLEKSRKRVLTKA